MENLQKDYDEYQNKTFERHEPPIAGAYEIGIVDVENLEDFKKLRIHFEILDGEFKDFRKNLPENLQFLCSFDVPYGETLNGKSLKWKLFQFIDVVKAVNDGFEFDWSNEKGLKGKKLGAIFQDYWYVNKAGYDTRKITLFKPISIDELKTGDYKIPEPYDTRIHTNTSSTKPSESKKTDEDFSEADIPF